MMVSCTPATRCAPPSRVTTTRSSPSSTTGGEGRLLARCNEFSSTTSSPPAIAEGADGGLAGFLVGFPSPADDSRAYIHFVGVNPAERGAGLGRTLYEAFFDAMRAGGRTSVHAVTSPVNVDSIAFHRSLGFDISGPVADYDGPGADRVVFSRSL